MYPNHIISLWAFVGIHSTTYQHENRCEMDINIRGNHLTDKKKKKKNLLNIVHLNDNIRIKMIESLKITKLRLTSSMSYFVVSKHSCTMKENLHDDVFH